jgi:hypothetical protein
MHPERVNRLVLYGASCGGQEGIPQTPEVASTISDFVNNRSQNVDAFLSVTFPPEWMRMHPNYLETIPKTTEIVFLLLWRNSSMLWRTGCQETGLEFAINFKIYPCLP